jgi:hypothetical protein
MVVFLTLLAQGPAAVWAAGLGAGASEVGSTSFRLQAGGGASAQAFGFGASEAATTASTS